MLWEDNYLMHYGIKGMKWGVRRWMDENNQLTRAGRARIDLMRGEYRRKGAGAVNVMAPGVNREARLMKAMTKAANMDKTKRYERLQKKLTAQQKANDDARAYVGQHKNKVNRHQFFYGRVERSRDENGNVKRDLGVERRAMLRAYSKSRARGASPTRAFIETFVPGGDILRMIGNKKKYGKAIVYSDMSMLDVGNYLIHRESEVSQP